MAKTRESSGPKGPRTSKAQSALASATIYFSRFSQKSRFSWHNLNTLMTAKMHEKFSRVSYLQHKHRVKKLERFSNRVKSYEQSKFGKNAAFVSNWTDRGRHSLERERIFGKYDLCLIGHNFFFLIDRDFF